MLVIAAGCWIPMGFWLWGRLRATLAVLAAVAAVHLSPMTPMSPIGPIGPMGPMAATRGLHRSAVPSPPALPRRPAASKSAAGLGAAGPQAASARRGADLRGLRRCRRRRLWRRGRHKDMGAAPAAFVSLAARAAASRSRCSSRIARTPASDSARAQPVRMTTPARAAAAAETRASYRWPHQVLLHVGSPRPSLT